MSTPNPSSQGTGDARVEKLKTNLTVDEMRSVALPASETPGLSVDKTAAQNLATGNENFNGGFDAPKGLTTERLFATRAGSDDERFERLEAAMQKLRDDFDAVNPSINRLIAIEREIQTLVDQLQVLVENDTSLGAPAPIPPVPAQMLEDDTTVSEEFPADENAASSTPAPMPLSAPPPPPPPISQPVSTPSGETLVAVRIADHDKKTRIVFETTGNLPYKVDMDPEKIVIVTFAKGVAAASVASSKTNSKLVKSIDQTPQNAGGFIIAMPLSAMSNIITQGVLKPDANNPNFRIYIDLAK